MQQLKSFVLNTIARQGFSFLLLALITYHFKTENAILRTEISACMATQLDNYKSRVESSDRIIQDFTRALGTSRLIMSPGDRN